MLASSRIFGFLWSTVLALAQVGPLPSSALGGSGTSPPVIVIGFVGGFVNLAFSSTPAFDASRGNTFKLVLSANVASSTITSAVAGQQLNFIICQDTVGNRQFAWPTTVRGGLPIATKPRTCSAQSFVFDGSTAYATESGVLDQ